MTDMALDPHNENAVDPRTVRRKIALRIVPLIFLLYIISYLDRANVGFAASRMQETLHFSDQVFGWAFGVFFVGYLLLEIPGALIVERWSARKWFARILITWGICSMGMALVRTPTQFYVARFLLGLAEAGFFPGVIVYFTHWFPRADRAKALAGMVLAIPVSLALGARVSGWLLAVNWFGLDGWQWVFLIEGAPAVIMGCLVPFLLTDRPRDATWLTPAERRWLEQTLEAERSEAAALGGVTLKGAMRQPTVWILALGIFVTNVGGYALVFWLPTVVRNLLVEMNGSASKSEELNWLSIVYVCGLIGVWLSGRSSDRSGERKWHCVVGQAGTGVCLILSLLPGQPWGLVFGWLCLMGFFAFFWCSPFWVLPTLSLSAGVAAVSIGFINMCANVAGLVGSPIVGEMKGAGIGERGCLLFLALCYLMGAVIISMLRVVRSRPRSLEPID
jgi:MFS transporter, ACS family, tartrate transporter